MAASLVSGVDTLLEVSDKRKNCFEQMTDEIDTLVQQIGDAFLAAAPSGWVAAELVFTQVGKTGEFGATASRADGAAVPVSLSTAAVRAFRRMRTLMAQPGKGAWFTATCRIEAPGKITFDFDYDHEPTWDTDKSVGHYLEEWEKHPRDAEHTPPWLAKRLAQAREWAATSG